MVIGKLSGKPDDLLWVLYERVSDVPSNERSKLTASETGLRAGAV